jgi:hypothetical protein
MYEGKYYSKENVMDFSKRMKNCPRRHLLVGTRHRLYKSIQIWADRSESFIGCTSDLIEDFSLSSPSSDIGHYNAIFSTNSIAEGSWENITVIMNGFKHSVSHI